jgi:protein gp37
MSEMDRNLIPVPVIARPADDLAALAAQIKLDLRASVEAAWERLKRYRAAGEKLLKAKEHCKGKGRGAWGTWLEANFTFTERHARRLMMYAKTDTVSVLEEEEEQWRQVIGRAVDDEADDEPDDPPAAPPAPPWTVPDYVPVDLWNELTQRQREQALSLAGESKFNNQGDNDNIEWALWSWNPVTGCRHDCPYCYARDIANRFYEQKFEPSLWPGRLAAPQNTTFPEGKIAVEKAKRTPEGDVTALGLGNVFTCSMADLFGRWVPAEWIEAVLASVRAAPQWNFLFLTKFPKRLSEFSFPDNAWVGTTVDCQARVKNAEAAFRKVKAAVKWLSCEPLIEPLKFNDVGIFNWVVIGGSSRSAQTPEWHPPREWVMALKAQAEAAGCRIYEKSNLWTRIRQYPGVDAAPEPTVAPEQLRYLPSEIG